jgi:hypothetical protein
MRVRTERTHSLFIFPKEIIVMILEEVMEDLIDSRIEEHYDYRPDLYPTKLL